MKSIWEADQYKGNPAVGRFLRLNDDPTTSIDEWRKALAEALEALDR